MHSLFRISSMEIKYFKFDDLKPRELYEILRLRSEIFVVEQNCVYQDLDNKDLNSLHLCMYDNSRLVAYLRCIPQGISYPEASIGRVVSKYRHNGNAKRLIEFGIELIEREFNTTEIVISSQCQAMNFYKRCGFIEEGESYLEDDIPHIQMRYKK